MVPHCGLDQHDPSGHRRQRAITGAAGLFARRLVGRHPHEAPAALAVVHVHARGCAGTVVRVQTQPPAFAVEAREQRVGLQPCALHDDDARIVLQPVIAAVAMRGEHVAVVAVVQRQTSLAAVTEAPAVGHRPRRGGIAAAGGDGAGLRFFQQQRRYRRRHARAAHAGRVRGSGHEAVEIAVQRAGVDGRADHGRVADQPFEERDVRFRTVDHALRQRVAQAGEGARAVFVPDDEFGDHRVVEDGDGVAFDHAGIDARVRVGRGQAQPREFAGARKEAGFRILRVQPHFDGVAALRDLVLRFGQTFTCGDAQLPFDQIEPGDIFGDRMLHLQASVDLHEIKTTVLADDEFHGAGVLVIDRMPGLHRRRAHRLSQFGREEGRRRFLQHFLIAALRRAFAFVEMDHIAETVAEDLDLDVPRLLDVAFQQHAIAAEGVARLALAAFQIRQELVGVAHDAHALAAAAVRGLDHQRITDGVGFAMQQRRRLILAGVARHHRHARGLHQFLGAGLAAHLAHRRRFRADEDDAGRFHGVGELRVLAEEAVARMDRLRAGGLRHFKDDIAAQIAFLRTRRADVPRFVGQAHVLRVGVGVGIHRDGADTQPPAGADDPACDFAAVGDEDLVEHPAVDRAAVDRSAMDRAQTSPSQ